MLTPAALDRVSGSYRRGYYDGYNGKPNCAVVSSATDSRGIPLRPFANYDYAEGYKAGANDRRWADKRMGG